MSSLPASLIEVDIVAEGQKLKPNPLLVLCSLMWVSHVSQLVPRAYSKSLKEISSRKQEMPDRTTHPYSGQSGLSPTEPLPGQALGCVWSQKYPGLGILDSVFLITTLCFG